LVRLSSWSDADVTRVSRIRGTFTSNKHDVLTFNILEFLVALREELARIFQYIDLDLEVILFQSNQNPGEGDCEHGTN